MSAIFVSDAMAALTRDIQAARSVALTTPDLDGDSVGALVGLARALASRWPKLSVALALPGPIPARYRGLTEGLAADCPVHLADGPKVDLAVLVDGAPDRLGGSLATWYAGVVRRAVIDHHRSTRSDVADVVVLDPGAASTTLLVLELCDRWGVRLDPPLAAALWAGLVYDTSLFRYRLTSPRALRAAARLLEVGIDHAAVVEQVLLQQPEAQVRARARALDRLVRELQGRLAWSFLREDESGGVETGALTDDLVFIEGVEVGALVAEREGRVKVSLRSRGAVDVARVAAALSPKGGGHARAAGATLSASREEVVARLRALVAEALAEGDQARS